MTPTLVVRQFVRASRPAVFSVWLDSAAFASWWGPRGVSCGIVEIDARVGGAFSIENLLPGGASLWISGRYLEIAPPALLRFSWEAQGWSHGSDEVTVTFEEVPGGTQVTVSHARIATQQARDDHEGGWIGCLEGLAEHFSG